MYAHTYTKFNDVFILFQVGWVIDLLRETKKELMRMGGVPRKKHT